VKKEPPATLIEPVKCDLRSWDSLDDIDVRKMHYLLSFCGTLHIWAQTQFCTRR
jgi:hypothetical protein